MAVFQTSAILKIARLIQFILGSRGIIKLPKTALLASCQKNSKFKIQDSKLS